MNLKSNPAELPRQSSIHARLSTFAYASRLYEALDTPVSLSCYLLLQNNEFDQLCRKTVDPRDYDSPLSFYLDRQATALLSKNENVPTTFNREVNCMTGFIESEKRCLDTNERLMTQQPISAEVRSVVSSVQKYIARWLPDVPPVESLDMKFSKGSTYGVRGDSSAYKKIGSVPDCTSSLIPVLHDLLQQFPAWIGEETESTEISVVRGGRLLTVSKNAFTHRPILIEPLLNGLMQRGYGKVIRSALLRMGIDLRSQAVNQALAKIAVDEDLATIDQKSSSENIAFRCVQVCLSQRPDWFEALNLARSPDFEAEQNWYTFQKFSSMGNGFTFELQTLIYAAMCNAVLDVLGIDTTWGVNVNVYGDDIILPAAAYRLFAEAAAWLGFQINTEKSFVDGRFFESCGHDYFDGQDVRPLYVYDNFETVVEAISYANNTLRIFEKISSLERDVPSSVHSVRSRRLLDVRAWVIGGIKLPFRSFGPASFGDCVLHSIIDETVADKRSVAFFERWAIVHRPSIDRISKSYTLNGVTYRWFDICPSSIEKIGWDGQFVRCWSYKVIKVDIQDDHTHNFALYCADMIDQPIFVDGAWVNFADRENSRFYLTRELDKSRAAATSRYTFDRVTWV